MFKNQSAFPCPVFTFPDPKVKTTQTKKEKKQTTWTATPIKLRANGCVSETGETKWFWAGLNINYLQKHRIATGAAWGGKYPLVLD